MKYLLSNGSSTDKLELYIVDLFKLYIQIYPGDIPSLSGLGFDFILNNVMKSDLVSEVNSRVTELVDKIKNQFTGVSIEINSVEVIDEEKARISITVNKGITEDITVNLYKEGEE